MAETNYRLEAEATSSAVEFPRLPYRPAVLKGPAPKIGLIGCGGISAEHLRAYRKAGYEVVAFCDSRLERAEARRREYYPDAFVTADHRELLGRPEVEIVDIATHPEERVAPIEDALDAGKHVLSQKPFVTDLETGERLVALAASRGLRLAVNQNGRWAPHFSVLRHAVAGGLVGEVMAVHMAVQWNHDWVAGTPFDEVHHVVLYDFAIHWFDMLVQITPEQRAKRVFASNCHANGQRAKPPLLGQVLVEFESAQATLVFDAFSLYEPQDSTTIVGTEGTLRSIGPTLTDQKVTLTTAQGRATAKLDGTWFPDGFHGTMAELMSAIEEDREPSNAARTNLASLELCFAALKSADTGLPQVPGEVRRMN